MASTVGSGPDTSREAGGDYYGEESHGYGWVLFAGTMLAIVGTLNFIYGIAAIDDSTVFVQDAKYVISDLNTWGWFLVFLGAIQFLSAIGIWFQAAGARWVGILSAAGNMVVQMLLLPAFPFLSLSLFAVDVLVIYGLLAYGKRGS